MKPIKAPPAAPKLPIEPTHKPSPEELLKVSTALVNLSQSCLLSPSAVIASLRCALDLYAQNAINRGFDVSTVQECEKLGQALAKALLDSGVVKGAKVQTLGLVDANGAPIPSVSSEPDTSDSVDPT
jgi:hypothetical protein